MKKRSLMDRLRAKKAQRLETVVGVCWYTPEEWERVKATATDPDIFEESFSDWEIMANESFDLVRAAYPDTVKVFVSADEFLAWCIGTGKVNNSDARTEFVSELLRKRVPRHA
jgi:hypothetical protein